MEDVDWLRVTKLNDSKEPDRQSPDDVSPIVEGCLKRWKRDNKVKAFQREMNRLLVL